MYRWANFARNAHSQKACQKEVEWKSSLCVARFVYVYSYANMRQSALMHAQFIGWLCVRIYTIWPNLHRLPSATLRLPSSFIPCTLFLFESSFSCLTVYAVSCRRDRWTCSARAFWLARALVHNIYTGVHDGWLLSVLWKKRPFEHVKA